MSSITLKVGESVQVGSVTITAASVGTLNEGGVQSKTVTIEVVDSSKAPTAE